jgi:hypothetical protein
LTMVNFEETLTSLTKSPFWHVFLASIALCSPGVLFLLHFFPVYFVSFDVVKILLVAISIAEPFVLMNFFPLLFIAHRAISASILNQNHSALFVSGTQSIYATNLVLLPTLLLAYAFKLSLHATYAWILVFQLLLFCIMWLITRRQKRAVQK